MFSVMFSNKYIKSNDQFYWFSSVKCIKNKENFNFIKIFSNFRTISIFLFRFNFILSSLFFLFGQRQSRNQCQIKTHPVSRGQTGLT